MGAESIPAYPSKDYITAEPRTFTTIKNIYSGGLEEVLVDPMHHAGVVTVQQQQAVRENLLIGDGVRITLEGNIGSGKPKLYCAQQILIALLSLKGSRRWVGGTHKHCGTGGYPHIGSLRRLKSGGLSLATSWTPPGRTRGEHLGLLAKMRYKCYQIIGFCLGCKSR